MKTAFWDGARAIVLGELAHLLSGEVRGSRVAHCYYCGKPYKRRLRKDGKPVRNQRAWCEPGCGRRAHYLPFNVRKIRRGAV